MPNWTNNTISAWFKTKRSAENFVRKHFNGDGEFDYDTVIPQPASPEGLPKEYLNCPEAHIEKNKDKPWLNWYAWNRDHWGVKWNACETYIEEKATPCGNGEFLVRFRFDSPWAMPTPVAKKLVSMHRNARFEIEWIEEQGVVDLGRISVGYDRKETRDIPEPLSNRAYEMMFEMWGNRGDYEFVDGAYRYRG